MANSAGTKSRAAVHKIRDQGRLCLRIRALKSVETGLSTRRDFAFQPRVSSRRESERTNEGERERGGKKERRKSKGRERETAKEMTARGLARAAAKVVTTGRQRAGLTLYCVFTYFRRIPRRFIKFNVFTRVGAMASPRRFVDTLYL